MVEAESADIRDEMEFSRDWQVLEWEVGQLREFMLGLEVSRLAGRVIFATLHMGATMKVVVRV